MIALYQLAPMALWTPLPPGLEGAVKRHANLAAYCERMKARYYAP